MTGLATGLHYLLSVGAQDALVATARVIVGGERSPAAQRAGTMALHCAAVPVGLALPRAPPPRAGDPIP